MVDRFCRSLRVSTLQYDGKTLPFRDDGLMRQRSITYCIMYRSPRGQPSQRDPAGRSGPVYIKDHESSTVRIAFA